MLTEPDLDHFFGGLETRFEGATEYNRQAACLMGSEFSVFQYITGELLLSDIIANLLDPVGTHGQGDAFLLLFLKLIQKRSVGEATCGSHALLESLGSKRPIHVRREYHTKDGRYIDIVLSEGETGLGIENKPGWVHQNEQVSHYADELARSFRKWGLIYLSGNGVPPPGTSVRSEKRNHLRESGSYLELNYAEDLVEWLDACVHACEADKVRWFLRDFQSYVAANFKTLDAQDEREDV